jgi:hypothetical protein
VVPVFVVVFEVVLEVVPVLVSICAGASSPSPPAVETAGAGEDVSPTPIGANGLGLPCVPSGVSIILESCKELKAGSEKIESFSVILLTFKSSVRKSCVMAEFASVVLFPVASVAEELVVSDVDVSDGCEGAGFKKKTYTRTNTSPIPPNINMFFILGVMLIF